MDEQHRKNTCFENLGMVPFVDLEGRFFIFFTVAFLLFLAPVGGSNHVGQIA